MDTTRTKARSSSNSVLCKSLRCGLAPGPSTGSGRLRRRAHSAVLGAIVALAGPAASAQTWHFTPSVALQETLTSNVNLSPDAQSDLVTQLTPQLAISEKGARTSLRGVISVPILLYVRTGAENNTVYPQVNLLGTVEGIERFFFLEGAVNVSQQFFTPFGAQSQSLANATENRDTQLASRAGHASEAGIILGSRRVGRVVEGA